MLYLELMKEGNLMGQDHFFDKNLVFCQKDNQE